MGKQRVESRNVRNLDDRSSAASRQSPQPSQKLTDPKPLLKLSKSVKLLKRYPLAVLLGAWAVLMFSGSFAVTMLLTPGLPEETESAEPAPRQVERPTQSDEESLPLLTYGTIAFSCAMGCLILARLLNMTAPRPVQRLEDASAKTTARSAPDSTALTESATQTIVSVVPSDQSQPLDWDEPSLADSLDLRQRRPLSYWL